MSHSACAKYIEKSKQFMQKWLRNEETKNVDDFPETGPSRGTMRREDKVIVQPLKHTPTLRQQQANVLLAKKGIYVSLNMIWVCLAEENVVYRSTKTTEKNVPHGLPQIWTATG